MKTLLAGFLLSATLISSPSKLFAQIDTAAISEHLNRQSNRLLKNYAVVVVKDNKVVYKRETTDITLKTPQPIGASSQWLTAALVMTLVQEGKISLDDKVSKYLPLFDKYYKGYVTIRHCLTHYTGIQPDKLFAKSKFKHWRK
jgi:CubicO group peptidase (beta-lactamase class C family)